MEFNRWSDNAEKVLYLLTALQDGEFDDRLWQIVDPEPSPADLLFELGSSEEPTQAMFDHLEKFVELAIDSFVIVNYIPDGE